MHYQNFIHSLDPSINPASVEAALRMTYGSISSLSEDSFRLEITVAKACEKAKPGYLASVAKNMGFEKEYMFWEEKLRG